MLLQWPWRRLPFLLLLILPMGAGEAAEIGSPHLCPSPRHKSANGKDDGPLLRISDLSEGIFSFDGGEEVEIHGSGFIVDKKPLDLQIYLGGALCSDPKVESGSTLRCTTTAHTQGFVDAVIRYRDRCDILKDAAFFSSGPQLSPRVIRLGPGEVTQFEAKRVVGDAKFSVVQGLGSIDPKGKFTAPTTSGTGVVQVQDNEGTSQATFNVYAPFSAIPVTAQLIAGDTLQVTPFGGVPPYSLAISSGDGKIEPTYGIFESPADGGDTVVTATDSLGNKFDVKINTDAKLLNPRKIAVGAGHSCVLLGESLECWGDNHHDQLRLPRSKSFSTHPVPIAGLQSGVLSIVSGMYHSCALLKSGDVKCWGDNQHGELGISGKSNPHLLSVPSLPHGIRQIVAGDFHTCISTAYQVLCWGRNDRGQLGDGHFKDSSVPVTVQGLRYRVEALAAGSAHSCLLEGKTVKCWGRNYDGQLGTSDNQDHPTPVVVDGLSDDIIALAAGWAHTCALTKKGMVKCWGFNGVGTLGNNSDENVSAPIQLRDLGDGVSEITAGQYHTCAIVKGRAECWGHNYSGQLGDTSNQNRTNPVNVSGLSSGVLSLAPGTDHSCALLDNQHVKCWGENSMGQLGDGETHSHLTPVDVNFGSQ